MSKKTTTTTTTTVVTTVEETTKKATDIYYKFILDRSGSMQSIQKQTVDSYNEQIGSLKRLQKEFPDQKYIVSLVIFDDIIETIIDNKPVNEVETLGYDTYVPRGWTALYDAIGTTIQGTKASPVGKLLTENVNDVECMVVVLTDGAENRSKEYNADTLKTLITEVDAKKNWSLMFIGATQESVLAAQSLGFAAGNTARGLFDSQGIKTMNTAMSNVHYRKAYAKSKGVELDNHMYLASVSDDSGLINEILSVSDIDQAADQKNNESTTSSNK